MRITQRDRSGGARLSLIHDARREAQEAIADCAALSTERFEAIPAGIPYEIQVRSLAMEFLQDALDILESANDLADEGLFDEDSAHDTEEEADGHEPGLDKR